MTTHSKIVSIKNYLQSKKKSKMFFLIIVAGAATGLILWNFYVENAANLDVKIPDSKNILFNKSWPIAVTTAQIENEFEKSDNKPILFYVYTTWCPSCTKSFPIINEIAREFQNTELQVIILAVDREVNPINLRNYLGKFGDIYFQPRFLLFRDGFLDFMHKKNARYNNHIPFTMLFSRNGEVITKFAGVKSKNFLRNKIIKELYPSE